jgi:hypothetical protein
LPFAKVPDKLRKTCAEGKQAPIAFSDWSSVKENAHMFASFSIENLGPRAMIQLTDPLTAVVITNPVMPLAPLKRRIRG